MHHTTLIIRGAGVNGVIHVGFRRWVIEIAKAHNCLCTAINEGDTVRVHLTGFSFDLENVIRRVKAGPPGARILEVTITNEGGNIF